MYVFLTVFSPFFSSSTFFRFLGFSLQGNKCQLNCEPGTYYNGHKRVCEQCHPTCATCAGKRVTSSSTFYRKGTCQLYVCKRSRFSPVCGRRLSITQPGLNLGTATGHLDATQQTKSAWSLPCGKD